MNAGRTALVLGSTGLVGRHLLARLLDDARWSEVRNVTRRPTGIDHPKLDERLVDFERIEEHGHAFRVHDVFCCLGTTLRSAGSREAFERVDHDYVRQAAEISAIGRVRHFLWISSLGANPHALGFYSRTKGRTEESIAALPLVRWTAVRPSLLLGKRDEPRAGERVAAAVLRPLTPFFRGPFRPYRPIHADQVASGMIALSRDEPVPPELQYISNSE